MRSSRTSRASTKERDPLIVAPDRLGCKGLQHIIFAKGAVLQPKAVSRGQAGGLSLILLRCSKYSQTQKHFS